MEGKVAQTKMSSSPHLHFVTKEKSERQREREREDGRKREDEEPSLQQYQREGKRK